MSIKNLSKFLFYIFVLFILADSAHGREEYPWSYNLEKGEKQFDARMYNDAYDSMRLALKKNPESYRAANVLGKISLIKKNYFAAEEYFTISLKIADDQPDIHIEMGKIDEYFQRDKSAVSHYMKSISKEPGNREALIRLARIYFRLDNHEEGEKYFSLCSRYGEPEGSAFFQKGSLLKGKDPAGAAELFQKAIDANPALLAAYIGLADSYRMKGDWDSAIKILEELKKTRPDYLPAYIYLGKIYFDNKRGKNRRKYFIELAIQNYETAIRLAPDNSDLYLELARIYSIIGDREKAADLERKAGNLIRR